MVRLVLYVLGPATIICLMQANGFWPNAIGIGFQMDHFKGSYNLVIIQVLAIMSAAHDSKYNSRVGQSVFWYFYLVRSGIGEPPQLLPMPSEVVVSSTVFNPVDDVVANLVIRCNVSGMPTPTVTWFREENPIDGTSVSGHTLFLNVTEGIDASRSGVHYYCLATNRIGPNNSIELTVRSQNILVRYNCEYMNN